MAPPPPRLWPARAGDLGLAAAEALVGEGERPWGPAATEALAGAGEEREEDEEQRSERLGKVEVRESEKTMEIRYVDDRWAYAALCSCQMEPT